MTAAHFSVDLADVTAHVNVDVALATASVVRTDSDLHFSADLPSITVGVPGPQGPPGTQGAPGPAGPQGTPAPVQVLTQAAYDALPVKDPAILYITT